MSRPVLIGIIGVLVLLVALVLNFWLLPAVEDEPESQQTAAVETAPAEPGSSAEETREPSAPVAVPPSDTDSDTEGTASDSPRQAAAPASSGDDRTAAAPAAATEESAPSDGAAAETDAGQEQPAAKDPAPSFDIVRVDPEGNAVIAGRSAPNSDVSILDGDKELGKVTADNRGEWVFIPTEKLPSGESVIRLKEKRSDGNEQESDAAVVLMIPEKGKDIAGQDSDEPSTPLAVLVPKDKDGTRAAATVLQAPPVPQRAISTGDDTAIGTGTARGTETASVETRTEPAGTRATGDEANKDEGNGSETGAEAATRAAAVTTTDTPPQTSVTDNATGARQAQSGRDQKPQGKAQDQVAGDPARPTESAPARSQEDDSTSSATQLAEVQPAAPQRVETKAPATPAEDAANAVASTRESRPSIEPSDDTAPAVESEPALPETETVAAPPKPETVTKPSAERVASAFPEESSKSAGDGVTVDVIDYDDKGEVVFQGKSEPGSNVEVFIDGNKVGTTQADSGGTWSMNPDKKVDPGTYDLRVDKISPSGRVNARIQMPFVRAGALDELPTDRLVVIQPGNNLWRIATRVYGSGIRYVEIHAANRDQIRDPDLIYPGQVFGLPDGSGGAATTTN